MNPWSQLLIEAKPVEIQVKKGRWKNMPIGMPTERTCPSCGETKPANQFYVRNDRPNRLSCYCKVCQRKQVRDSKARNK